MAPPESLSPLAVLRRADRQLLIIALCLLLVAGTAGSAYLVRRTTPGAHVLGQTTIAVGAGGTIVEVVAPEDLVPGTRVLAGLPESGRLAQEQLGWLAAGTVPQIDGVEPTMITAALLDLHVLGLEHGVPVAGQSPAWHYVWPRDSALVAVALARTGHDNCDHEPSDGRNDGERHHPGQERGQLPPPLTRHRSSRLFHRDVPPLRRVAFPGRDHVRALQVLGS